MPLSEYFPERTYGVVMRKHKQLSPQALGFLELMEPEFQQRTPQAKSGTVGPRRGPRAKGSEGMDFMGDDESLT